MINRLRLKYFDNNHDFALKDEAYIDNGGYKFLHEYKEYKSFIDFEIDGKSLIKHIWKGNYRGFLDCFVGALGFIDKALDELMILYLLKEDITKVKIVSLFEKYGKTYEKKNIEYVLERFNRDKLWIYVCRACADEGCGGIKLKVEADEQYYYWSVSPEHNYMFRKEEYEHELQSYINIMKYNTFDSNIIMNLYKLNG